MFRGLAARLNFMSLDGPDLQIGVKTCSREMARPVEGSFALLKKMARYLVGRREVVWEFAWQTEPRESHLCADSDWRGHQGIVDRPRGERGH